MYSRYFRVGDRVIITLPSHDITVTPGMRLYDGLEATISKACKAKAHSGLGGIAGPYGFELKGVVSAFGIPYTFTKDMLTLKTGE